MRVMLNQRPPPAGLNEPGYNAMTRSTRFARTDIGWAEQHRTEDVIIRWITTTLLGHVAAATAVAACTLSLPDALAGGAFYAVGGIFYLFLEAPLVLFALWLFRHVESKLLFVVLGMIVVTMATVIGRLLTFREGGAQPPEYLLGYTIGGALVGCLVCLSGWSDFASRSDH
jgi:hypothetical protein